MNLCKHNSTSSVCFLLVLYSHKSSTVSSQANGLAVVLTVDELKDHLKPVVKIRIENRSECEKSV